VHPRKNELATVGRRLRVGPRNSQVAVDEHARLRTVVGHRQMVPGVRARNEAKYRLAKGMTDKETTLARSV
jgi:hypothetical protein